MLSSENMYFLLFEKKYMIFVLFIVALTICGMLSTQCPSNLITALKKYLNFGYFNASMAVRDRFEPYKMNIFRFDPEIFFMN